MVNSSILLSRGVLLFKILYDKVESMVNDMDVKKIGMFISSQRKAQGMTQEQLAVKLGVSNKSVSKWERGKCMPDLSIYEDLCEILHISINELFAGEIIPCEQLRDKSDDNVSDLFALKQKAEDKKMMFIGLFLIVLGRLPVFDIGSGSSDVHDFILGFSRGISIGITLIGLGVTIYGIVKMEQRKI